MGRHFLRWTLVILGLAVGDLSRAIVNQNAISPCQSFLQREGLLNDRPEGPNIFREAPPHATEEKVPTKLRIATYNVYNLIYQVGQYKLNPSSGEIHRVSEPRSKAEEQIAQLADEILGENPDILFLQEVEGYYSLCEFARVWLKGRYHCTMIEGNDTRGIDTGLLTKKELPLDIEVQSHRALTHDYLGNSRPIFSRDLPIATFWLPHTHRAGVPIFAIGGVHNKSQRDGVNDPRSALKREAQSEAMAQISRTIQKKYGKDFPLLFAGDFNAHLPDAEEYQTLRDAGFTDAFNLFELGTEDRVTHSWHRVSEPQYTQLDAILISKSATDAVESIHVVPHYANDGEAKPLPTTRGERDANPSDHFMIVADLDIKDWLERLFE